MTEANDFWFGSGHVALDLSLSGGAEWRSRWERLYEPADLDAWLAACALEVTGLGSTEGDLAAARDLREGLWGATQAVASDERPPEWSIGIVNAHARRPSLSRRLALDGTAQWHRPTTRAALASIADAAVDLLSTPVEVSGPAAMRGGALPSPLRRHVTGAPPPMVLHGAVWEPPQGPHPSSPAPSGSAAPLTGAALALGEDPVSVGTLSGARRPGARRTAGRSPRRSGSGRPRTPAR